MFKSLYGKLILAFMLVAFTTAALVALFIRLTSADRLMQLIIEQQRSQLEQTLSSYYASTGSWVGVEQNWGQIQSQALSTPEGNPNRPSQGNRPPGIRGNFMGLADAQGKVIVSGETDYPVGSTISAVTLQADTPVLANGIQVGTILMPRQSPEFSQQESHYLQRTNQALLFAILGTLVVALVVGALLARTLTRPLRALTHAAQTITQGQLAQQVTVRSNDEIGQLAIAFNQMSQEVARVNKLRKQMTADIAHDLRTPLTVISGYIEGMRDGVLKPTPERLSLIYSEIERLQNLVGDLRMLSLADAGELSLNPQALSPINILDHAATLFRLQAEQQGVTITVQASDNLPLFQADEARLMQVLGNVIFNALHYTSAGGKVMLVAQRNGANLEIRVQDTGSGIPPEELPRIFDRFHRADSSRHAENGESGLGLAIVKALVEAHGGSVSADSTPGEGTTIHLLFPLSQ